MKGQPLNLVGKTYGLWSVVSKAERRGNSTYWNCICTKCKTEKKVRGTALVQGRSGGCGSCKQWKSKRHLKNQIASLRSYGLTVAQVCRKVGVTKWVVEHYQSKHHAFNRATWMQRRYLSIKADREKGKRWKDIYESHEKPYYSLNTFIVAYGLETRKRMFWRYQKVVIAYLGTRRYETDLGLEAYLEWARGQVAHLRDRFHEIPPLNMDEIKDMLSEGKTWNQIHFKYKLTKSPIETRAWFEIFEYAEGFYD